MSSRRSHNTFINNTLLVQIIFVSLVVSGVLIFEKKLNIGSFRNGGSSKGEASLIVDFGDIKRAFEGEVVEKMTILDALNASVAAGNIKLRYTVDSNNNTTIMEINSHQATKEKGFQFYINGKKINSNDLNKTMIRSGDKVVIKYEK